MAILVMIGKADVEMDLGKSLLLSMLVTGVKRIRPDQETLCPGKMSRIVAKSVFYA